LGSANTKEEEVDGEGGAEGGGGAEPLDSAVDGCGKANWAGEESAMDLKL